MVWLAMAARDRAAIGGVAVARLWIIEQPARIGTARPSRRPVALPSKLPSTRRTRWAVRDETRIITASEGWQSGRMRRS